MWRRRGYRGCPAPDASGHGCIIQQKCGIMFECTAVIAKPKWALRTAMEIRLESESPITMVEM